MNSAKTRVLVTGGGGYVGSNLCKNLLEYGYEVRAMDNFHKGNCDALIPLCANKDFEFVAGDITKEKDVKKAVDGIDYIAHLGAIVGFPAAARNPALSHLVNVQGTKNIVNCKGKNTKLLFASTGSVYGKIEGVCTEDSPLNPQSEYGVHKKEAEDYVTSHENGVAYRFATGFGVSPCMRVNLLINDLTYQAYANKCLTIFQSEFRRTFIHIVDMGSAFIFGIKNFDKFNHKVYNVGSKENNWTKRELAENIAHKTEALVTYADVGVDLDARDYEVDYSRMNETGWKAKYSVEYGIDEILKVCPLIQIRHNYE